MFPLDTIYTLCDNLIISSSLQINENNGKNKFIEPLTTQMELSLIYQLNNYKNKLAYCSVD